MESLSQIRIADWIWLRWESKRVTRTTILSTHICVYQQKPEGQMEQPVIKNGQAHFDLYFKKYSVSQFFSHWKNILFKGKLCMWNIKTRLLFQFLSLVSHHLHHLSIYEKFHSVRCTFTNTVYSSNQHFFFSYSSLAC